ncbi:unnamed protein product [Mucor hiemalis]
MVPATTLNRTPSLYDSIPNLDSWYECKNDQYKVVPCSKKRSNKAAMGSVSFSSAPPAVYHYEDKELNERPVHRRSSSSEHVKELLKHYTSKLSRQLSHRSNSNYRA